MPQLAQAQFTLTDDTDIVISIEPPENATKDMLWLSVGQNPITLYRWSGAEGYLGPEQTDAYRINSKTNYAFANTTSSILNITNINQLESVGLDNFSAQLFAEDINSTQTEWSISLNREPVVNNTTIGDGFAFNLDQYCSFVFSNIASISFSVYAVNLWAAVRDSSIDLIQQQLINITSNLANLSSAFATQSERLVQLINKTNQPVNQAQTALNLSNSSGQVLISTSAQGINLYDYIIRQVASNKGGGICLEPWQ